MKREDRILQRNLKILLQDTEDLDSISFSILDKNNAIEILKVIEHSNEKSKSLRKFS
jgi:hypothetical protein